jgi:hypothetical protein
MKNSENSARRNERYTFLPLIALGSEEVNGREMDHRTSDLVGVLGSDESHELHARDWSVHGEAAIGVAWAALALRLERDTTCGAFQSPLV